jgi:hypothetical protein
MLAGADVFTELDAWLERQALAVRTRPAVPARSGGNRSCSRDHPHADHPAFPRAKRFVTPSPHMIGLGTSPFRGLR